MIYLVLSTISKMNDKLLNTSKLLLWKKLIASVLFSKHNVTILLFPNLCCSQENQTCVVAK